MAEMSAHSRPVRDEASTSRQSARTSQVGFRCHDVQKILATGSMGFEQSHPGDADRLIVYACPDGDEVAPYTRGTARLAEAAKVTGEPPRINVETALAYRQDVEKCPGRGKPADRKRIVRSWVEEIKLAPDRLEVDITYKLPEPVMNGVGAGGQRETLATVFAAIQSGISCGKQARSKLKE